MCLSPITLSKQRARLTYTQSTTQVVPCGRCSHCLRKRVNDWAFRLLNEMEHSTSAIFLTLTYDNENLPIDFHTNTYIDYDTGEITEYNYPQAYLKKDDFQKFMKRLRKTVPKIQKEYTNKKGKKVKKYVSNLKYYACGEYGSATARPHYHAVLFNLPMEYTQNADILYNIWNHGHIHIGNCSIGSIKYVCKYINKRINKKNTTLPPEFSLMSKNIGINWLQENLISYYKRNLSGQAILQGGQRQNIPRYYKDKMFDTIELHKIKLQTIDYDIEKFKTTFNSNYLKLHTWKQNQIRIHEKNLRLNRQDL